MKAKLVKEGIGNILKPKGIGDVLNAIKDLSVEDKIKEIKKMQRDWGDMFKNLLNNQQILNDIKSAVKKELDQLEVIQKINYIEQLEKDLPEIFNDMRDDELLNELASYIRQQSLEKKSQLIWRFFKSWPDLFKDVEDDPSIDEETNKIMLLFKIKGAINSNEIEDLQSFISQIGERYGRENVLDMASKIYVPTNRYDDKQLFNKKDIQQLKLSLYKETRSEEESLRDEYYDVYAFIGYPDFIEKEIDGETFHKKLQGIENLVKINKYDANSLAQVSMMKIRANAQGTGQHGDKFSGVFGVYIPKFMWDKDYAYNQDIPSDLRKFIEENKFKF